MLKRNLALAYALELQMSYYNEDLIAMTLDFWQERTDEELSRQDANCILDNLTDLVDILERWDEEDNISEVGVILDEIGTTQ